MVRYAHHDNIFVFYDSHCGLCTRSAFGLKRLDWFNRLKLVDYHDEHARRITAPELRFEDLDNVVHIKLPDGRTMTGFRAFRHIARFLPLLWPVMILSYLPGATVIGKMIYKRISSRCKACTHEDCR